MALAYSIDKLLAKAQNSILDMFFDKILTFFVEFSSFLLDSSFLYVENTILVVFEVFFDYLKNNDRLSHRIALG